MSEEKKEGIAAELDCLERLRRLLCLDGSMDLSETDDLVGAGFEQNEAVKPALERMDGAKRAIKDLNLVALRERKEEVPLKSTVAVVPAIKKEVRATGMEAGAFAAGYRYRVPGHFPVERDGVYGCPHKGCAKVEEFGVFALSKEEALHKMHRH
jgi:hypothetical protein